MRSPTTTSENEVHCRFGPRCYSVPSGTVDAVKAALAHPTGLVPAEMKLVKAGKTLKEGETPIASGAKLMLMRQPHQNPRITLNVRELVTGRASSTQEVDAKTKHDTLVLLASKALRLPPCDESMEVRLFLPHTRTLMRPDLTLRDYVLPDCNPIDVWAVPCPAGLHSTSTASALAARARAEQQHIDELAAHAAASIAAAAEAGDADAMRFLELAGGEPPLALPPSLADDLPISHTPQTNSVDADAGSAPAARHPASYVPRQIRTGLMPSPDDIVTTHTLELPAALLTELDALEACAHPISAAEWEGITQAEEELLEARCAHLVSALAPSPVGGAEVMAAGPRSPERHARSREIRSTAILDVHTCRAQQPKPRRSRSAPVVGVEAADIFSALSSSSSAVTSAFHGGTSLASTCGSCAVALSGMDRSTPDMHRTAAVMDRSSEDGHDGEAEPSVSVAEYESGAALEGVHASKHQKIRKGVACVSCGTRLPLTATTSACKCGNTFCAAHMHDHKCTHDYQTSSRAKLAQDNPKLEVDKLERM